MFRKSLFVSLAFVLLLSVTACKKRETESLPPEQARTVELPNKSAAPTPARPVAVSAQQVAPLLGAFAPLPEVFDSASNPLSEAKVKLGRMLFYEERLSKNHDASCNTCHVLDNFGGDGKPVSQGHRQQPGTRNSPTVYNAAGHFAQFWDGRAADVEEQAKGPILNPVEMAMKDEAHVVAMLKSIPGYVKAFKAAFPDDKHPVTFDNAAKAIGAFERKLVTPSRFDRLLKGDTKALTGSELAGLKQFVETGCTTCHSGALIGGHMFQKLGLVKPWPNTKDQGRYEHTKKDADRMMFKVPSLRNVAKTAPYFHDGSVADLKQAVIMIADHQLGRTLDDAQAASIVTFLQALTGDLPSDYIKEPELPESGRKTPRPDPT